MIKVMSKFTQSIKHLTAFAAEIFIKSHSWSITLLTYEHIASIWKVMSSIYDYGFVGGENYPFF